MGTNCVLINRPRLYCQGHFYLRKENKNTLLPLDFILTLKGIVFKLTIKFWMCQKCGKMRYYKKKKEKEMTASAI
jgi:ribosomal protein L33